MNWNMAWITIVPPIRSARGTTQTSADAAPFMGAASALVCVVPLADLIGGTIVIQAMFQFILQGVAVVLMRRKTGRQRDLYRMPLYPLPVVVTLLGWLY